MTERGYGERSRNRRRYRIVSGFRFTVFMTVSVLFIIFTVVSIAARFNGVSGATVDRFETRTVMAGETLWSIASEYNDGSEDIRKTIFEICEANDVSAETLQAGQEIMIPLS